jgi:hypothetical protein
LGAGKSGDERGKKTEEDAGEEDGPRRRKKGFRWKSWKKTPPKKTEFQTATIPPLSFRP